MDSLLDGVHLIHVLAIDLDILEKILATILGEKRLQHFLALLFIGGTNCLFFFCGLALDKNLDFGGLG